MVILVYGRNLFRWTFHQTIQNNPFKQVGCYNSSKPDRRSGIGKGSFKLAERFE